MSAAPECVCSHALFKGRSTVTKESKRIAVKHKTIRYEHEENAIDCPSQTTDLYNHNLKQKQNKASTAREHQSLNLKQPDCDRLSKARHWRLKQNLKLKVPSTVTITSHQSCACPAMAA